jgi:hypothetical protein
MYILKIASNFLGDGYLVRREFMETGADPGWNCREDGPIQVACVEPDRHAGCNDFFVVITIATVPMVVTKSASHTKINPSVALVFHREEEVCTADAWACPWWWLGLDPWRWRARTWDPWWWLDLDPWRWRAGTWDAWWRLAADPWRQEAWVVASGIPAGDRCVLQQPRIKASRSERAVKTRARGTQAVHDRGTGGGCGKLAIGDGSGVLGHGSPVPPAG